MKRSYKQLWHKKKMKQHASKKCANREDTENGITQIWKRVQQLPPLNGQSGKRLTVVLNILLASYK